VRRLVLCVLALVLVPAAHAATAPTASCSGPQVKLLDTSNTGGVLNGARPPSFSTKGKAYCLLSITTYHWNNGKGRSPGTIGLTGTTKVAPVKAKGSSGQGGAPNVNWQVTYSTTKPVVVNGTYSCSDSDPKTWSQNPQSHGTGFCIVYGQAAKTGPPTYTCSGGSATIFDNSNGFGVLDHGTGPTFSTKGKAYCLGSIVTYHWHGGKGAMPGTLGLTGSSTAGPFKATGSAGQGGAPNVNWTATPPSGKQVILNGTYTCTDSDHATWSQNQGSGGKGFCKVHGVPAVQSGGGASGGSPGGGGSKPTTTIITKVGKPTISGGGTTKKGGGKLSIKATPDSGSPPLTVTFTLGSPKVVQWRVDFGDGQSKVAIGQPPATLTHTYKTAGNFTARLSTINSPGATAAATATTNVSVGSGPLIGLVANPPSGNPPLAVTFSLVTSATNISSWTLDFGDGSHIGGTGRPPATAPHTYKASGAYKATFSIKSGAYSLIAAFAQVVVGGGAAPVLSLSASPTSGTHPLTVKFALAANIPGQIVSWELIFGDGSRQTGSGKPPASVGHTYSKAGTYGAYLVVSQQQAYGGVQYTAPKGGLAIVVR
jgi:PKD repeat protein